ncbi:MAG: MotA/TolQ/ExbB proton channel family protein [Pseudomonadota bacterium]
MIDQFGLLGPLGYPLLLCSVLGLALILERAIVLSRLPKIGDGAPPPPISDAVSLLDANRNADRGARSELLSAWLDVYAKRVEARLKWLSLIAAIAPMLGLLGTVLGMTRSFQSIADHTGPVSPQILSGGLWEAMLTTLVGLTIAIVVLVANHIFRSVANGHLDAVAAELNRRSMLLDGLRLEPDSPTGVATVHRLQPGQPNVGPAE